VLNHRPQYPDDLGRGERRLLHLGDVCCLEPHQSGNGCFGRLSRDAAGAGRLPFRLGHPGWHVSALVSERVPTHARATSVGWITSTAAAIFGGTAPYPYAWLNAHDAGWVYNAYLVVVGLISAPGGYLINETAGKLIEEIGVTEGAHAPARHASRVALTSCGPKLPGRGQGPARPRSGPRSRRPGAAARRVANPGLGKARMLQRRNCIAALPVLTLLPDPCPIYIRLVRNMPDVWAR